MVLVEGVAIWSAMPPCAEVRGFLPCPAQLKPARPEAFLECPGHLIRWGLPTLPVPSVSWAGGSGRRRGPCEVHLRRGTHFPEPLRFFSLYSRTHLEFLLEIERQCILSEYTKAQNNMIPESSVCQEAFGPASCIRITELLV